MDVTDHEERSDPLDDLPGLGDDVPLQERLPKIMISTQMGRVVDAAEAALRGAPEFGIYQRAGKLVRVRRGSESEVCGICRPRLSPVIEFVPDAHLLELMGRSARWFKHTRTAGWQPGLPPEWAMRALAARGAWSFPILEQVVEAPVFLADGRVLDRPGYDPTSGLLYDPGGVQFPGASATPNGRDASAAMQVLMKPFSDFPFVTESDRAAYLALLLTLFARPAIAGPAPMFVIQAHTPGTGKGLLADSAALLHTGRAICVSSPAENDAEWRKRITSIALAGTSLVLIDNVEYVLGSPSLAAALTASAWSDRILCKNESAHDVPLRAVWIVTGNNVTFKGDLGRRIVPIYLDAGCEHPEDRNDFELRDLRAYILEHRPELVSSALTILRAFHVTGRQPHDRPLKGSFEDWDRLVRAAVIWLVGEDPLAGCDVVRQEADADLDSLKAALVAWREAFGDESVTVVDAIQKTREGQMSDPAGKGTSLTPAAERLRLALAQFAECDPKKLDGRLLGYALRKRRGRIANGLRFVAAGKTRNSVQRWQVVEAGRSAEPGGAGDAGDEGDV